MRGAVLPCGGERRRTRALPPGCSERRGTLVLSSNQRGLEGVSSDPFLEFLFSRHSRDSGGTWAASMLHAVPGPYAIAQVTPYPWEDAHEVNVYVAELAARLAERGHRVLIVA